MSARNAPAKTPLRAVPAKSPTSDDLDTPERFAKRTLHLRTGSGQPLESTLFKLRAARPAQR
jgi:hypothetical protein